MSWLVIVCGDMVSPLLELPGPFVITGGSLRRFEVGLFGDVNRVDFGLYSGLFVSFLAFHCCGCVFCSKSLMKFFVLFKFASWPEGGLVCILGHSGPSARVLFRVV